jgi:hypothetical protein
VSATGKLDGTGFMAVGRRTLHLVLAGRRGTVSLVAQGPPVEGFTPP